MMISVFKIGLLPQQAANVVTSLAAVEKLPAKFIIFNTQFLVFNTKFIIFSHLNISTPEAGG